MSEMVLMKGNEAMSEAAIKCGCRYYFGYPITPQNEIAEYMAARMPQAGGFSLQAESEIAAINMVLGASAAGARVFTSSSSPGISLKTEGISYIAGSDLPCVIANVQRGGPGLGGIQPAQSDYHQATKAMGHGDMRLIVLAPNSVQEIAEHTVLAFDLADLYRTPVMILTDGALGQMMEPVDFGKLKINKPPEKTWAAAGHSDKRPPNIINSLYLDPKDLEAAVLERYKNKYNIIDEKEVRYEEFDTEDADIVIVSYGIVSRIAKVAVNMLKDKGVKAGYFRPVTLSPFPSGRLGEIAETAKRFLVSELNMGQMTDDVRLAAGCKKPVDFFGRTGGIITTPEEIYNAAAKVLEE
ncbi:MAG: 3-methyl-2-oxobutanoate dehydrogenase subunit VorB [Oscillospiraceae bacterium]|nr:3-methyl-2-oxobutanoate dehydrogenase subunit VorB [Oscillospiraceae bacterium]